MDSLVFWAINFLLAAPAELPIVTKSSSNSIQKSLLDENSIQKQNKEKEKGEAILQHVKVGQVKELNYFIFLHSAKRLEKSLAVLSSLKILFSLQLHFGQINVMVRLC